VHTGVRVVRPEPLPTLLQQAQVALSASRFDVVEALCARVLGDYGEEANALMLLGLVRVRAGRLDDGIALLERARVAGPAHPHVLSNLGSAYRRAGRLADARTALEAALVAEPRFAVAHHNLGNVLLDVGDRDGAAHHYGRAAELQPSYAEPLAALADMAECEHRLAAALTLAERALAADARNSSARLTRARAWMRTGDVAAAVPELEALLGGDALAGDHRVVAHGCLGDAYDKLGEHERAFAQYTAGNRIQLAQHAASYADDRGYMSPPMVERLHVLVSRTDVSRWPQASGAGTAPVFVVGFPRSGTTLLDQVLASHPDVSTLEEQDTLIDACRVLLAPGVDAADWEALTPTEVAGLRTGYWDRVGRFLPEASRRPVLVDKFPLDAILLPVIHRLFPDARIVLVLRDPRDVIMSCYQQRFGMNGAMYQLLRLDTAALFYDRVMGLVRECRQRLPLTLHEVRYEGLVADFDATVAALLEFLGLPWSDTVRDYAETARLRHVRTPSAAQVVQPLYRSSQGKWRNYRQQLEPVLPILQPWVRSLGYAD
jgi:tetratricopeptide (TPR) repeat protein